VPAERRVDIDEAAIAWRAELEHDGYEHHALTARDARRLHRLSRSLRQMLRVARLQPPARVLEVGCGGGAQLVPLAAYGFECVGVDSSSEVLTRLLRYAKEASHLTSQPLTLHTIAGTFPDALRRGSASFDLVFENGVVEHVLDADARTLFHRAMVEHCRRDGFVVHIVPNGTHPLRQLAREQGLGSYCVPEIDYTPTLLADELARAGLSDVRVLPVNLLGYLVLERGLLRRLLRNAAQFIPRLQHPKLHRHALTLLGVGRRISM
jgi:2-polyprenyl-3-methyl-5-hydroxy-6-metoxy-1,4-benzoquinol methylase